MYKKFVLIALFLVMLASMNCISASDNMTNENDALATVEETNVQSASIYNADDDFDTNYNKKTILSASDSDDKMNPHLSANIEKKDAYVAIISNVEKNATGSISIEIVEPNKNITIEGSSIIEDGSARWSEFIAFSKGDYIAKISYLGDENYYSTSIYKVFEIEKSSIYNFSVSISTDDEFIKIVSDIDKNATGNVTIRVKTSEEENYTEVATVEIENGTATWIEDIPFDKGSYVAYTTYNGDENYFPTANTQQFKIKKQIPEFYVDIIVRDYLIVLNATLPENATGNVTVRVKSLDKENYTESTTLKVKNGTAVWSDFVPFSKGNYVAYTTYNGDKNYFKAKNTQNFTIEKQVPNMFINSTVSDANANIIITLPENATGTVTFTNNRTGEINTVELDGNPIEFNESVQYGYNIFMIKYSGDDYYFGIENTHVVPLQIETSLSTKDTVSVTYRKTASITVKLSILNESGSIKSDGEPVTISVNNRTYTGILENGTVTIKIAASYASKYIPNTYTANVTFEGSAYLKNASTSFKLVVKKGTPKLTAKAKTFKVSTKTKKYTITLKNHKDQILKNTKVYLKVFGKTFKATTNSKGQATFKITNLNKKAKYVALIKYNGNKCYNAVSKKIKITVKK